MPCYLILSPNFLNNFFYTLPIFRTTIKYWYILWKSEQNFGGAPYISCTFISSLWLEVSEALTRSRKATKVVRFWLFLILNRVLIVKIPPLKTILEVPPNWYFFHEYIISQSNINLWHIWVSWTWCPLKSLLTTFSDLTIILTLVLEHIEFYVRFRSWLCHDKRHWWSQIHIFYNLHPWLWIIPAARD